MSGAVDFFPSCRRTLAYSLFSPSLSFPPSALFLLPPNSAVAHPLSLPQQARPSPPHPPLPPRIRLYPTRRRRNRSIPNARDTTRVETPGNGTC
ncbi:hypothetical protein NMY22_g2175 [Coprinellus aureogranulatus]|nr:hypothetical protein NMY22_g2175 [Coprinellus aureogranulatus]